MPKLDGKVALVTGGTSGIGFSAAKALAAEGAHTYITGRRERELSAAVEEIGRNASGVHGEFSVSRREAFFRKQVAWIRRSPSGGQSAPATRPSHHGRLTLIASSARRKRVAQSRSGWR